MHELVERPVARLVIGSYAEERYAQTHPDRFVTVGKAEEMQKTLVGTVIMRTVGDVTFIIIVESVELENGNIVAIFDPECVVWGKKWKRYV